MKGDRKNSMSKPKLDPKTAKWVQKQYIKQKRLDVKTATTKAKTQSRMATQELRAKTKGGITGYIARRREMIRAKHEAQMTKVRDKPILDKQERQIKRQTEAATKQVKAKGAAMAGVASALGAAYASGKNSDARKSAYEAARDSKVADSLQEMINSVPEIQQDPTVNNRSVSGLVSGVR